MSKYRDCVSGALNAGKISKEQAQELLRRLEEHEGRIDLIQPPGGREAERIALNEAKFEKALARRQKSLQIVATHNRLKDARAHPDGLGVGVLTLLARDLRNKATNRNLDTAGNAWRNLLQARMAEAMSAMRTRMFGMSQDKTLIRNVVREAFGQASGDSRAAKFAKDWLDTAEFARQQFNRFGGAIGKLEKWGMPQFHDAKLVGRVDKQQWIDDLLPMLDLDRMKSETGVPYSADELRLVLDNTYERIISNGMSDLLPGRVTGGKKLANRHRENRFLVFKDGDTWLQYHDKYGRQDLFASMTGHLDTMAHDIARVELFGPNPEQTWRYMFDTARKEGELTGAGGLYAQSLWNVVSGKVDTAQVPAMADFTNGVRNYITASRLGSAALSAVSDIGFLSSTANWNGLSATRLMTRYIKGLNPLNEADRIQATKMFMGADAWVTRGLAANRFVEVAGAGFSAKAADFTMRATGLSKMTDAGKTGFAWEFYGAIGDHMGKSFEDLPKRFRKMFERYGVTPEQWARLAASEPLEYKGAKFLDLEKVMAVDDAGFKLGLRMMEIQRELGTFAIPEPDARARAVTTMGLQRGTIAGEGVRFMMQFKSFPVSSMMTHLMRGIYEQGAANKVGYLSQVIIATTVMGALALQLKEISKGKEPRNMDDKAFWGAAFLQGGGAGIYADFIYSGLLGEDRFGHSIMQDLGGPLAGLVDDVTTVAKAGVGAATGGLAGSDRSLAGEMIRFGKMNTPYLSSAWYGRLAFERTITDQLELAADPMKARRRFRVRERNLQRDKEQGYWWSPGEPLPGR